MLWGRKREKEVKRLIVTDNSKQHLKELLLGYTDDPDFGVRLVLIREAPRWTGLVLDRELPGDQVVEYEGLKVLLVGDEVAPLVAGATLCTKDTPHGTKLVISAE